MKVYIAGPITGRPELNRPAFDAAAKFLVANGYEPVNPHEVAPYVEGAPWDYYMRKCIAALTECHGVAFLDGHYASPGATEECRLAREVFQMPVAPLEMWTAECAA